MTPDERALLQNLTASLLTNFQDSLILKIGEALAEGKLADSDVGAVCDILVFSYKQGIDDAAEALLEILKPLFEVTPPPKAE